MSVPASYVSPTEVSCVVPQSLMGAGRRLTVSVANFGDDFFSSETSSAYESDVTFAIPPPASTPRDASSPTIGLAVGLTSALLMLLMGGAVAYRISRERRGE